MIASRARTWCGECVVALRGGERNHPRVVLFHCGVDIEVAIRNTREGIITLHHTYYSMEIWYSTDIVHLIKILELFHGFQPSNQRNTDNRTTLTAIRNKQLTTSTMDYEGQRLVELIFSWIIISSGAVAWVFGYIQQDFKIVFKVWLAAVAFSIVVRPRLK